jgi:hypothetical protein
MENWFSTMTFEPAFANAGALPAGLAGRRVAAHA